MQRKPSTGFKVFFSILLWSGFLSGPGFASGIPPPWQLDWEKTVHGARKEGQVVIYSGRGSLRPMILSEFQKDYPDIKTLATTGHSSEIAPRLLGERRAEKYLADVYIGGPTTLYHVLHRAKALDPIAPLLLLPEVVDKSLWWEGKHFYIDPEGQYIFVNEGSVEGVTITYNTSLVKPEEFKSKLRSVES